MGAAASWPRRLEPVDPQSGAAAGTAAFEAFFVAEFPRMVVWATALIGDPAVAEEVAQEALLRAYRHWPKVSGYDRPGAWTRRVTTNLALSARTRRRAEAVALERMADAWPEAPRDELRDADEFWSLVRELPRRQRAAVALYYLEDWSIADIAAELGCAPNTAKAHLFKGRRTLARLLGTELDG
jgi:RNA polymerase sigma-70 factor (ECF subfamily)